MSVFQSLNISGSALTTQRLKLDVISSNIANASTTRGKFVDGEWVPYRRKMVEVENRQKTFESFFNDEVNSIGSGTRVTKIVEDKTPFQMQYDPNHPDADRNGYVKLPNVDLTKEMVDMLSASRAYEANVTAFNAGKTMMLKALEIGK